MVTDVLDDDGILDVSVEMLCDVMFGVGVEMSSDTEIIMLATPAITLKFVVGVAYAVDVLAVTIPGVATAIDVDMLTENGLAATVTALEFALSP